MVDRTLNAPILGAAVRELRRDGSEKLQSGLSCEEAAAEIVKEISDGPWDADLTEATINNGGFLSSASEDGIIEKLVDSVYQHESINLAVRVAENAALTTRIWWAFVGELVERYRSADKTTDLLSFVTKSKAVVIRELRALRSSAALPVLETFIKTFLSAVAGEPGGHLVLDPLIDSGPVKGHGQQTLVLFKLDLVKAIKP
ncbi:hypothetical protein FOL46_006633 [Perkinsus olseni]|uniref:Uncharacterized protein n=1 Tax=Perkinsus olseni TaxID=32597 RepID=A0A7J6LJ68_PEROL|nr:hypothetical protein FOL46_006633 [Perkinsus olseni]